MTMTCSSPPPLTEDQLSALIDGDADAETLAHVAACPSCAARLEAARHFEARLAHDLFRVDCPPAETLGEYFLEMLPDRERPKIAAHLQKCVHCQAEMAVLTGYMPAESPSSAMQKPKAAQPKRNLLSDLVAVLLPNTPALALRGSDAGPLMATAEDGTTIFLEVMPEVEGFSLMGQIAADDPARWSGAMVEMRQNDAFQGSSFVNEFGSFQLPLQQTEPVDLMITSSSGKRLMLKHVVLSS
jgi:hypothetical protein